VKWQGSQVVEKYMREIYGERLGEWCGEYSYPQGVRSGEEAMPLPEKNANDVQKRLNLVHIFVYFCYFLTTAR